jgi:hypothetical protein
VCDVPRTAAGAVDRRLGFAERAGDARPVPAPRRRPVPFFPEGHRHRTSTTEFTLIRQHFT